MTKYRSGRHFLQVPGPTNIPDRILRAIDNAPLDHRSVEFFDFARELMESMKRIFRTSSKVAIFPGSGTGAWEAAIANTLSPGDKVLMFETGQFGVLWRDLALKFGLDVDFVPGDWRHAIDVSVAEAKLAEDKGHRIKAVMAVHNETSTGVVSRIADIRKAMDKLGHPALLMVDTVSSLGAMDYRHDEWGVDVTVAGSQKGLMLPPGIGMNAMSAKAIAAGATAKLPRAFWDWAPYIAANETGSFPYTPPVNLMYGLRQAIAILEEEGLENVYARHRRLAEATRRAVRGWGLEVLAADEREASPVVTAVMVPNGFDGDAIRKVILDAYDMSLGAGLGKVKGKIFRIGHLGYINELALAGALCGVEMGLGLAGVPHKTGGVLAALGYLGGPDKVVEKPKKVATA